MREQSKKDLGIGRRGGLSKVYLKVQMSRGGGEWERWEKARERERERGNEWGRGLRWGERSCRCSRRPQLQRRSYHSHLCAPATPTALIQFSWSPPLPHHHAHFRPAASHTLCLAPPKSNTDEGVFDDRAGTNGMQMGVWI